MPLVAGCSDDGRGGPLAEESGGESTDDADTPGAAAAYPACPLNASCEQGSTCLSVGGANYCASSCMPDGPACPAGGECVAQTQPGPATRCALACDPTSPACPGGMICFDLADDAGVIADAVCVWPERG